MSGYGPWSVKGIDERAREVAKEEARLKGMTLGRYINGLLLGGHSEAGPRDSDRLPKEGDMSGFNRLAEKVQALENGTIRALSDMDASIHGLSGRLEVSGEDHQKLADNTAALLKEMEATQAALLEKIDGLERRGEKGDTLEALKGLEIALGKLAAHVYEENALVQDETSAIKGRVEAGFAELGERLDLVDLKFAESAGGGAASVSERLNVLENAMSAATEGLDTRLADVETQVSQALNGVDGSLGALKDQVEQVQTLSAKSQQAVDEKLSVLRADLEAKLADTDGRTRLVLQQIGDQTASASQRLQVHQERAVARISEQVDAAGERQARHLTRALETVSDRFSEIQDQTAFVVSPVQKAIAMLAARIELIEDGERAPAGPRLTDVIPDLPVYEPSLDALHLDFFEEMETSDCESEDVPCPGDSSTEPDVLDLSVFDSEPGNRGGALSGNLSFGQLRSGQPKMPAGGPAPVVKCGPVWHPDEWVDDRHEARDSDVFEEAAQQSVPSDQPCSGPAGEAQDYLKQARHAAIRANGENSRFFSSSQNGNRGSAPAAGLSVLRRAVGRSPLVVAGLGLAVIAVIAGIQVLRHGPGTDGGAGTLTLVASNPSEAGPSVKVLTGQLEENTPVSSDGLLAAPEAAALSNLLNQVELVPDALTLDSAAERGDPIAQYQLSEAQFAVGDISEGVRLIEASAGTGLSIAEYRLAKLHEQGLGVPLDLAEARYWTERAALGGNVMAMHDMAVFLAEGEGGPQSYSGAVNWFRQAAERGVVDSQFNLAILHENGLGVSPNAIEALYWFSVAAENGDSGAEEDRLRLSSRLGQDISAGVAQRAAVWSAGLSDPVAQGQFAPQDWEISQRRQLEVLQARLTGLGHPAGPPDGLMGPSTREAIRSFQAEIGLPEDGEISAELVAAVNAQLQIGRQTTLGPAPGAG